MHNVQHYESEITHAKSSKPSRMLQWYAVDRPTSLDLGGQNVLKTFEMAIRHYKAHDTVGVRERERERERESFLLLDLFSLTFIIYDILLILQYHVSSTVMDLIVVFCIVSCLYFYSI